MASSLTGRVALITGGSKGIGAALAIKLASLGANVAIAYSSDESTAATLIERLNSITGSQNALAIRADASTLTGIKQIVQETVSRFGKIDLLIPMAGVMQMRTLLATSEDDFDASFALNVKGPYFLAQQSVPHMPKGSTIIFIGTSVNHASTVAPPYLLYCATKGAVEQMTRVLAKELSTPDREIAVNCVAPGPTGTELFFRGKSEELVAGISKSIPRGRIGEPEEVADTIALLCAKESRWVTGQLLKVNGGMC